MGLIERILRNSQQWPVIVLFVSTFFGAMMAFAWRSKVLGHTALDSQLYGPKAAKAFLQAIGQDHRNLYAATQLTLDIVFPVVYAAVFGWILICLYPVPWVRYVVWAPVAMAAADWLENVTTAYLALSFREEAPEDPVAYVAGTATALKWLFFLVCVLAALVGLGIRLVMWWTGWVVTGDEAPAS